MPGSRSSTLAGLILLYAPVAAWAQAAAPGTPPASAPAERSGSVPGPVANAAPAASTSIWTQATLLGDAAGLRPLLGRWGVSFGATETDEVLGNSSGGYAHRAAFEGLSEVGVGIDLGKTPLGLSGGIIEASAFQIHGRGLSADTLGVVNTISSLEADRSTRLFELWYQQSLLGGKADIKIGQQQADLEFIVTQYGGVFINSGFGWPTLSGNDLPSGGPAYPLATPAVRLRVQPNDRLTALLGVFDGSAGGLGTGDPQRADISGTRFDLDSGLLLIAELQYAINGGDNAKGLPGTFKLGGWYSTRAGDDPLAPPNATQLPRRDIWDLYALLDQLVYRPADAKDGGAGLFIRAEGSPGPHESLDAFLNGGITYKGAFGRANDTVGLGFGLAHFSAAARGADALGVAVDGIVPRRGSETVIELTYQLQVAPWWQVQPDFQYVLSPGGGIPDATHTGLLRNEAVWGVRSAVTF